MKTKTFLSILGIIILIFLFSMQGTGYCYKVMDTLAPGDAAETEDPEKLGSNTNAVDRAFNVGQRQVIASGTNIGLIDGEELLAAIRDAGIEEPDVRSFIIAYDPQVDVDGDQAEAVKRGIVEIQRQGGIDTVDAGDEAAREIYSAFAGVFEETLGVSLTPETVLASGHTAHNVQVDQMQDIIVLPASLLLQNVDKFQFYIALDDANIAGKAVVVATANAAQEQAVVDKYGQEVRTLVWFRNVPVGYNLSVLETIFMEKDGQWLYSTLDKVQDQALQAALAEGV